MNPKTLSKAEAACPSCREIILKGFVSINGYCPVCNTRLRVVNGQVVLAK